MRFRGSIRTRVAHSNSGPAVQVSVAVWVTVVHASAMRRALAYVITAPLVLLGVFMAHQASYIAVAGHDEASRLLAQTGHGYLDHAPTGLIVLAGTLVVAIAFDALRAVYSGEAGIDLALWPFAAAGPAAFFVQEHLERYLADGGIPWAAALEPTFILGLLLQAPAAVLTYGIARRLMHSARRLAGAASRRLADFVARPSSVARPWIAHRHYDRPRRNSSALRFVAPGRAPPTPISG